MAGLHAPAELRRLLHPESIAIVGASARAGAFGARVLRNLALYRGRVHLVNARYREVAGRPCHARLGALPEAPDCVVLAVPREAVAGLIGECVAVGAGGAIVFASGYGEAGRDGEQAALKARAAGMPVLGPNCIGIANYLIGAGVTFSAMPKARPVGEAAIGVVSQSGALGFALAQAIERGVAISHVLTAGNSCDVDVADLVAYLAAEPGCRAVACLFEGMAEPGRMVAAARACRAAGKALVVHKMAQGTAGAEAARSHTGAMAGDEEAWRAVLGAAGAIVLEGHEGLIETARFFAKARSSVEGLAPARGVAVLATSGGAGIMAADAAERHGVALPQPVGETASVLRARVPAFGAPRNPCDVTGQVLNDPESLLACAEALLADPAYAALVVPQVFAYDFATPRIRAFGEMAARHGKLVCHVWLSEWLEGPGAREAEAERRTALFRSMERCFAAVAWWMEGKAEDGEPPVVAPGVRAEVGAALDAAGPVLTEREAKGLLARYGVTVSAERLAASEDEAVAAALALGLPVALKIDSPDLLHKSEAGALRLGLGTVEAVRAGYAAVLADARASVPGLRLGGVLVSRMAPAGVELIVGARADARFGPLLMVGFGGVLAEVLAERRLVPAPLTAVAARRVLAGLRGWQLLAGYRGGAKADLDALCEAIARISVFAADQWERFASLDVNPLTAGPCGSIAVDALIERAGPSFR